VIPHWAKGLDEPLRVYYDVGLGREFAADELHPETPDAETSTDSEGHWRIIRARNKWQPAEDCARHPMPGTYPIVVTGEAEWGGWRVPGAEYDLDPEKVERQARMIASAPKLVNVASNLVDWARRSGEDMPSELVQLAHDAQDVLTHVNDKEG
jgi:hypothetical protein